MTCSAQRSTIKELSQSGHRYCTETFLRFGSGEGRLDGILTHVLDGLPRFALGGIGIYWSAGIGDMVCDFAGVLVVVLYEELISLESSRFSGDDGH